MTEIGKNPGEKTIKQWWIQMENLGISRYQKLKGFKTEFKCNLSMTEIILMLKNITDSIFLEKNLLNKIYQIQDFK